MNNINEINHYGLSVICSQLTGFLFLENVKMEKQRTNMSYRHIIPHFLTPKTFINGFFPYGAIQAYSKGFIFGLNQVYMKPIIQSFQFSSTMTNILMGLTTGITEALFTSPLLYARLHINKQLIEGKNKQSIFHVSSLSSIFKGVNILVAKRTIDWSTRFMLIDAVTSYLGIESKMVNIFIGASISSVFSAPVDRLLPIIYTRQRIQDVIKTQGLSFFYKGFTFRCLSTAHYTMFILLLPEYLKNNKK